MQSMFATAFAETALVQLCYATLCKVSDSLVQVALTLSSAFGWGPRVRMKRNPRTDSFASRHYCINKYCTVPRSHFTPMHNTMNPLLTSCRSLQVKAGGSRPVPGFGTAKCAVLTLEVLTPEVLTLEVLTLLSCSGWPAQMPPHEQCR